MKIAGSDGTNEPRMFIQYYGIRSTSSRRSRREVSTHSQYTLTWSNTPLLTPCFAFLASAFLAKLANYSNLHSSLAIHVIQFTNCFLFRHKNPYTETTHLPCLNFAIYAVHMQSYNYAPFPFDGLLMVCIFKTDVFVETTSVTAPHFCFRRSSGRQTQLQNTKQSCGRSRRELHSVLEMCVQT